MGCALLRPRNACAARIAVTSALPIEVSAKVNSSFVFCTSYFEDQNAWEKRYARWLDHHAKVFPGVPLFVIDDGSPYAPEDPGITIGSDLKTLALGDRATIFHFPNRLGRPSLLNYPGWFRSFTFSVEIARRFNFRKIIHVESDAFILSHKALDYINGVSTGWTAFWYPDEAFAETCLQVICEDKFAALNRFRVTPYETQYANKLIELHLPFTHIERGVRGSRHGGPRVPSGADFAVLTSADTVFTSEFD